MENEKNTAALVPVNADDGKLANLPKDSTVDTSKVNDKELMRAAIAGDLTETTLVMNAGTAGALAPNEVHAWTPQDRKAIAARAAVKIASAIAKERAQALGFLRTAGK